MRSMARLSKFFREMQKNRERASTGRIFREVFVMGDKRILLSYPHMSGDELECVRQAFQSNWIAPLGPMVELFERECAHRCAMPFALALSSGTAALHLAVKLLGVKRGDCVFCSDFTFIASAAPAFHEGAQLTFIDSAPDSWNMSPAALEKALQRARRAGKLPKAVIVAELYGLCPDMDAIAELCRAYGVPLVEDAAEALGSTWRDHPCGSLGDLSALSFNGNKIITTSGGGMLLTCEKALRDRAFFLATQARDAAPWYQHSQAGYNYRMSNIAAAIGVGQIKHLDERVTRRRAVYHRYCRELADLPVTMMPVPDGCRTSAWLSCLTIDRGQRVTFMDLYNALNDAGIETRPLWKPMHLQPVFSGCPCFNHGGSSVCEDLFGRGLCLPSASAMSDDEQSRVIEALKSAF